MSMLDQESKNINISYYNLRRTIDIVLFILVVIFFITLLISSFFWPLGAALGVMVVSSIGLLFSILYFAKLLKGKGKGKGKGNQDAKIYDVESSVKEDDNFWKNIKSTFKVFAFCLLWCFLLWCVGFHIGIPAAVMAYLFKYANVKWWVVIIIGIAFEILTVGIFDLVFATIWPEPLILKLFKVL